MDDERQTRPDAVRYPTLSAFLQGYLHQDYALEHESLAGAVRAWRDDAGDEETARLFEEWRRFMAATRGWSVSDRAGVLIDELGSAWAPRSSHDLRTMSRAVIASAGRRRTRR